MDSPRLEHSGSDDVPTFGPNPASPSKGVRHRRSERLIFRKPAYRTVRQTFHESAFSRSYFGGRGPTVDLAAEGEEASPRLTRSPRVPVPKLRRGQSHGHRVGHVSACGGWAPGVVGPRLGSVASTSPAATAAVPFLFPPSSPTPAGHAAEHVTCS
ncbi:hypothetical protein NL676_005006 [Syzygium grande]|nr:hypothetical protein NL676_005006 [Syzygium grande]